MTSLGGWPGQDGGWSIRPGSPSPRRSPQFLRSRDGVDPCLRRRGPGPARGAGSLRSPTCWTRSTRRAGCGSSSAKNARTPGPTAVYRHRRTPLHLLCHQHQGRATRRSGLRHRRRADARTIRVAKDTGLCDLPLRAEPDLVRTRRHGVRVAGLDADARFHRARPALGPPRLGLRIFSVVGRLVCGGRRQRLGLALHRTLTLLIMSERRPTVTHHIWLVLLSGWC